MQWKHDKIFEWLDLPYGRRPQLITGELNLSTLLLDVMTC